MNKIITTVAVLSIFLFDNSTTAQNLNFTGPWTFTSGPNRTSGDVDACRDNAPAGTFWAGQPVMKAEAAVNESWFGWSSCLASSLVNAQFTVGPAPTLVEFESTLNADRLLQDAPGTVMLTGAGEAGRQAIMLTDVTGACDGTLDYEDFALLKDAWVSSLEGGSPVASGCHAVAIGDAMPPSTP